jgi:hypothetical protein
MICETGGLSRSALPVTLTLVTLREVEGHGDAPAGMWTGKVIDRTPPLDVQGQFAERVGQAPRAPSEAGKGASDRYAEGGAVQ